MDNEDNLSVINILNKIGFESMTYNKDLISARMKDALYLLPKAIAKITNPPLPAIENVEASYKDVSDDLQGEGLKFIIPWNIIDNYTD